MLYLHDMRPSDHPLHAVLRNMRNRCHNPNAEDYPRYGGRGITVCDRWRDPTTGFAAFLADMGERPETAASASGYGQWSIERRDNDGPYSPDNCVWASPKQQAANRRPMSRKPPWT